jgi:hypothetical protein
MVLQVLLSVSEKREAHRTPELRRLARFYWRNNRGTSRSLLRVNPRHHEFMVEQWVTALLRITGLYMDRCPCRGVGDIVLTQKIAPNSCRVRYGNKKQSI